MKNIKGKTLKIKKEHFIEIFFTLSIIFMNIVSVVNILSNRETKQFFLIGITCTMTIITIIIDYKIYKIDMNE